MMFDPKASGHIIEHLGDIPTNPVQSFPAAITDTIVWQMFCNIPWQVIRQRLANRLLLYLCVLNDFINVWLVLKNGGLLGDQILKREFHLINNAIYRFRRRTKPRSAQPCNLKPQLLNYIMLLKHFGFKFRKRFGHGEWR
jgi:hypothetical protein